MGYPEDFSPLFPEDCLFVPIFSSDVEIMQRAIQLARNGFGWVEPNPMVGAVVVSEDGEFISEGYHQRFGGPHAEVHAIHSAGQRTHGAQLFVSLEPCSHFGKTPPCAEAVIAAGFRRVVIGCQDPAPHVAGRGIHLLKDAGLKVDVGLCEAEARRLIAPFEMLMLQKRPWIHAKWAMTLDGRIASHTGHSKWISCEQSRAWVHDLRGRVDAIITGAGTVRADDPLLTARPAGARVPLRVVVDSSGESITRELQLVKTRHEAEVLVCVSQGCSEEKFHELQRMGLQTFRTTSHGSVSVAEVAAELGRRQCTHVLLEAGPRLMGAFFEAGVIDEVHAFVAPKLVGGLGAPGPVGGRGLDQIPATANLVSMRSTTIGTDVLIEADVS